MIQRGTWPGQGQSCRTQLVTAGSCYDIRGTRRALGTPGFMQPLNVLDYSMVYLKCNLHLHDLLDHKLLQVVYVICTELWQPWLSSQVPKLTRLIALSRGPLYSSSALSDLATLKGPPLLCGADKRVGDVIILSPMKGTGSSGEILLLMLSSGQQRWDVFSDASLIH